MSDTPRMDLALRKAQEDCTESYLLTEGLKLERKLNAANARIKRLEDAGDAIMKSINCGCPYGESVFYCQTCISSWDAWRKVKDSQ